MTLSEVAVVLRNKSDQNRTSMAIKEKIESHLLKSENTELKSQVKELKRHVESLTKSVHSFTKTKKATIISPSAKRKIVDDKIRVIIPDSHGSAIDHDAAAAFLSDLKALNPDEIVMLGDHVDCGGFLAQHHTLGYVAQTAYSYEQDLVEANSFLDQVQKSAPRAVVHYLEGNHESRCERWVVTETLRNSKDSEMLRKALVPEYLLKLKERGIAYYRQSTKYHGCNTPGTIKLGKCYFTHGVSTARHAAAVNTSQFAGNVVFGHIHRAQSDIIRPVATGTIAAWCPGCLCKDQPLWCHTRPTNWTHGFGIQIVAKSGNFLHINVPIVNGVSLLDGLLSRST